MITPADDYGAEDMMVINVSAKKHTTCLATDIMSTSVLVVANEYQQVVKWQNSKAQRSFPQAISDCIQFYQQRPVDNLWTKSVRISTLNGYWRFVNKIFSTGGKEFIANGNNWI